MEKYALKGQKTKGENEKKQKRPTVQSWARKYTCEKKLPLKSKKKQKKVKNAKSTKGEKTD